MSALVTEHFVQQSAASATIAESSSRASLYLLSLSSSLVALGFATQSKQVFPYFAAAILPAIFVLGIFSFVRVTDTAMANLNSLRAIVRIRRFYAGLLPEAPKFFGQHDGEGDMATVFTFIGTTRSWINALFSMASTLAAINSLVAGVGVVILLVAVFGSGSLGWAVAVGVVLVIAQMVVAIAYQLRRFAQTVDTRSQ
ncbi:MAG TPA: hypothetical protein VJQ08_02180 [Candidatus Dormibacteraeota bacterium]|nr:hypothetical protein [Candidatus Dormibacteraeota bacterium]